MRHNYFLVVAVLCVLWGAGPASAFPGQRYADPPPFPVAPGPGPSRQLYPADPQPQPLPFKTPVRKYRYYPNVNIYLDPLTGQYWSHGASGWTLGPLPAGVPLNRLGMPQVIWGEDGRPWLRHPAR